MTYITARSTGNWRPGRTIRLRCKFGGLRLDEFSRTALADSGPFTIFSKGRKNRPVPSAGYPHVDRWICGGTGLPGPLGPRTRGRKNQDIRKRGPGQPDMRTGQSDKRTRTLGHEGQDSRT